MSSAKFFEPLDKLIGEVNVEADKNRSEMLKNFLGCVSLIDESDLESHATEPSQMGFFFVVYCEKRTLTFPMKNNPRHIQNRPFIIRTSNVWNKDGRFLKCCIWSPPSNCMANLQIWP